MHEAVIKKRHPARSGLAPREATGEDRLFPGAGEVTVASRLAAGRGDSLAFPFIRHLPWWVTENPYPGWPSHRLPWRLPRRANSSRIRFKTRLLSRHQTGAMSSSAWGSLVKR